MKKLYVGTSGIEGRGLFAGEPIAKGRIIQRIQGEIVRKLPRNRQEAKRIMNWIGVGKQTYIRTARSPFRFINHSCNPNAAIIGSRTVVAIRPIRTDDEITIDYSMSDADPYWEMTCHCGSRYCRKVIGSIQSIPMTAFKRHMPHIPRNFQRIYIKNHVLSEKSELLKKAKTHAS